MNKIKILLINPYDSPDYLYRSIMEGLHNFNCELYYTHPDRLAKNVLTDEEAIHISSEVDYIFVIWDKEKPSVRPIPKYYLLDRINKKEKVVYIDGSEYNWTAYPGKSNELLNPHMIDKCRWYFKRECLPEHEKQGVFSLPFSAIKSDFGNFGNFRKFFFRNSEIEKNICSFYFSKIQKNKSSYKRAVKRISG